MCVAPVVKLAVMPVMLGMSKFFSKELFFVIFFLKFIFLKEN